MNDGAYIVYKGLKTLIKNAENCHNEHDFDQKELLEGWKDSVEILESSSFGFKARYDREMTVINSFSREQNEWLVKDIEEAMREHGKN